MKKLLIIVALATFSHMGFAQLNTISISYGVGTTDQWSIAGERIIDAFAAGLFGNLKDYESKGKFGALTLSYHRTLPSFERFSYGASFAFENHKYVGKEDNSKTLTYTIYTIAPEAKFKYLKPGSIFNIYGLLGAGITVMNKKNETGESKNFPHFNFQITPLGIEVGRQVKGFAEMGFGYKGMFSGGVQYRF